MNKKQKREIIIKRLNERYKDPKVPLYHFNNFSLLIAVILSAQSTDKKVNEITPELFQLAKDPKSMRKLGEKNIHNKIKEIGLAKQKAKYIYLTSSILEDQYGGIVPNSFKDLEQLPGVGHKTASVVMAQAFGIPAFPVDTHIHRLSQRWGLTNGKSVLQTEIDLKEIFPREMWNKLHIQIILYGREFCSARNCDGTICQICKELYPKRKKPFKHNKA